ncbi:MAG: LLM class flavin-dependent oxidoreductase, partial [Ilumatobacteraceae bacterium]
AEFTLAWEAPNLSPEEQAKVFPLLQDTIAGTVDVDKYVNEDMIIVGTPEQCLEKIIRYDEAGVDQLLCYVQFGYLPHEKVLRNLELLGTHVIPELERRGHRVDSRVASFS